MKFLRALGPFSSPAFSQLPFAAEHRPHILFIFSDDLKAGPHEQHNLLHSLNNAQNPDIAAKFAEPKSNSPASGANGPWNACQPTGTKSVAEAIRQRCSNKQRAGNVTGSEIADCRTVITQCS